MILSNNYFKIGNKMKIRQLIVVAVVIAAVVSCTAKKTLSEQLIGKWSGIDTIQLTMIDSLGNTVVQEFTAPIEIECMEDSTFTASVTINEGSFARMGGIIAFSDSTALFTGTLSCKVMMDLNGGMAINEDKTMTFKYAAENPAEGLVQRGVVSAIRLKE